MLIMNRTSFLMNDSSCRLINRRHIFIEIILVRNDNLALLTKMQMHILMTIYLSYMERTVLLKDLKF